jgi:hypothetical protein
MFARPCRRSAVAWTDVGDVDLDRRVSKRENSDVRFWRDCELTRALYI